MYFKDGKTYSIDDSGKLICTDAEGSYEIWGHTCWVAKEMQKELDSLRRKVYLLERGTTMANQTRTGLERK